MSDGALEFAEERGLGKVLGRVRLDSGIAIPGGARTRANLLLSESGLWLVAARDRFHGQHLDLLTRGDVRLVAGRIRDRLCFGQEALTIPASRRHAVERLIALARLSSGSEPARAPLKASRLVQLPDELGQAWLKRELGRDEVLVAWLRGENLITVHSHLLGEVRCTPYLFLSERRAAIVAWSAVGDVSYAKLCAERVQARSERDRTELVLPEGLFLSRRSDGQACRDAFELLRVTQGEARLFEAARRSWFPGDRSAEDRNPSLALLEAAISHGSQKARFARLLGGAELSDGNAPIDPNAVAQALATGGLAPHALGDLWLSFRFSARAGSALVRALLELGPSALPFAFALQRRIYATPGADAAVAEDELRLARFAVETRLTSPLPADERDRALADVLQAHGLSQQPSTLGSTRSPLSAELIEGTLSHPLARGQNSLVAGAQKLIALSPEPDHTALSDYCEALDSAEHPQAKRALDAARLAFSLPQLRAYVSRGKKSIGMRGYEGDAAHAAYILLGKAHLDDASEFFMTEGELAFAIGSEALHLKLGQARLTSNEVWAGAFARTKGGVELVLGLLPLLKGLPLATSVTKFLDKIPEPALRRGLEALVRFEQRTPHDPNAGPSALSHINENLVAAHRLMQMSADRAGLVLSGDLRASLRGMLLVRPDTRALLGALVERDLVSALLASELDPALRRDLLVRVAALLHFYGSDDYVTLRRALGAP